MEPCQVCGRHPAKSMTFKAHQGFVLFRRETEISGVFCRDHAMEAYLAARGATLKGMWFSPSSLVFGAVRSLYDSVKLLDLPVEVKDEPWVPHVVACPHCTQKNVAAAGPTTCEKCGQAFVVASCSSCNTVHVLSDAKAVQDIHIRCRTCHSRTKGAEAVRNWAYMMLIRGICEASATVASARGNVGENEREAFNAAIRGIYDPDESTIEYINKYFDKCTTGNSNNLLKDFRECCTPEYRRLVLLVALSIAKADGFVDENENRALHRLAKILGFDPSTIFHHLNTGDVGDGVAEPWWEIFKVSVTATMDEVTFAYRKLAMQFHPDLWVNATDTQQQVADAQMKKINAAFQRAKQDIAARESKVDSRQAAAKAREEAAEKARQATAEKAQREATENARKEAAEKARQAAVEKVPREEAEKPAQNEGTVAASDRREKSRKARKITYAVIGLFAAAAAFPVIVSIAVQNNNVTPQHQVNNAFQPPQEVSDAFQKKWDAAAPGTSILYPDGIVRMKPFQPSFSETGTLSSNELGKKSHAETLAQRDDKNSARRELVEQSRSSLQSVIVETAPQPSTLHFENRSESKSNPQFLERKLDSNRQPSVDEARIPQSVRDQLQNEIHKMDFDELSQAIELASARIERYPRSPDNYIDRGIYYCRKGSLTQAEADFARALELDPRSAKALRNRGVVQTLKGLFDLALRDFDDAINLEPNHLETHKNRDIAVQKKREAGERIRPVYSPDPTPSISSGNSVDRSEAIRIGEEYYRKRAERIKAQQEKEARQHSPQN